MFSKPLLSWCEFMTDMPDLSVTPRCSDPLSELCEMTHKHSVGWGKLGTMDVRATPKQPTRQHKRQCAERTVTQDHSLLGVACGDL